MKYSSLIGVIAALAVIGSCTMWWIVIPDKNIHVSGFVSGGTRFGKPGLINAFMSGVALLLFVIPRVWAKRANLFFAAFNLAWAIRNYILLSSCHGGDCPEKQAGLYLLVAASALLLAMAMALFPDLPVSQDKKEKVVTHDAL
ncbi:MAG: hypothetical protein QM664_01900 [Flavihumibacter sp.]